MKMVKSLLLGSAAGVVAIAGAQAADLPVKAAPVAYVKICSLYGVGFYYVPGTDMCLKLGGWARYEQGYGYNSSFTTEFFNNNLNNRSTNDNNWRVKGVISVDARDQTPFGTVRSYVAIGTSQQQRRWWRCRRVHPALVHPVGGLDLRQCDVVLRLLQHWRQPVRLHHRLARIPATAAGTCSVTPGSSATAFRPLCRPKCSTRPISRTQTTATSVFRGSNASGLNYRGHDYPDSGRQYPRRPGMGLGADHGRICTTCPPPTTRRPFAAW